MKCLSIVVALSVLGLSAVQAQSPEPSGWYAGDMHVHRSCGGSPVSESSILQKMSSQNNLSTVSLLADMGNGEVQNPITDLPLVNGNDDPQSTAGRILHWDAEWHWDATYSQYAHQALGGHIVSLGLKEAHQIWDESTDAIFQWAHAQDAVTGFAHMEYLDNLDASGMPSVLNCCMPIEYPVEVALGSADYISEDVNGSDSFVKAYYQLLNSGFRPGIAAGTDYPCNDGTTIGNPMTYVRVANNVMTYRNWIDGIASGRTVVSRNGHNEFIDLKVNGTAGPGDEIDLTGAGQVSVSVQWTAAQNLTGSIDIVQNGNVFATKQATLSAGGSTTLTATLNFTKSGWLAARRMDPNNGHVLHTAAVYIVVENAPIRANATDPQYFVQWTNYLLSQTSPGGAWNYFFPTELTPTQARYQAANALFQQIAKEAQGNAPALSSITVSPANRTIATGNTQQLIATGNYSDGSSINITSQVAWSSSNTYIAAINKRGLAAGLAVGTTTVWATQGTVVGSTTLNVQTSPLTITTPSLPAGMINAIYSATLTATGGTTPYTWTIVSGSLPGGLTLNASSGVISGAPAAAGTFSFVVQVSDSGSLVQVVTQPFTIAVGAPGTCPCSIWPGNVLPGLADGGADSPVELGIHFRADTNGYITGIRFYRSSANTGTHVGNLWSSAGVLLATATFTGETSSGWQQVNFSNPVAINAGTVYVASYHTTVGHYAYDSGYFANGGVDNSPLHALQDTSSAHNGVFNYGDGGFPSDTWSSTNYWVDVAFMPSGPDTTPPTVVSASPASGASGVDTLSPITATFSEALDSTTVNGTSMSLLDPSSSPVAATVTYNSATNTVTLTPNASLLNSTTYTAIIKGGGVKDLSGNALLSDYKWSFTTAAPPPPPPSEGPGGPILIVSSSTNPFSRYYAEILRNEGFNEFTAMDISLVSADTLNSYEVVILGTFPLTAAQAGMFTSWVNNGGNLIAMRPDKQLAGVLGLTDAGAVLNEAYLMINTASPPGAGLVNQTIQFHGTADRYIVNGATTLATLYSSASASTVYPAVTLYKVGQGQAAAFTYDLAKSVVYTRQGNPAWSGEARDGQNGPMRSDDLFYGNASFDPEPDYVDLNKVAIPQADEQQRLLANLMTQMNLAKQPLPRFWYFPRDTKAVVVMSGDDHGALYNGGATAPRFDHYLSLSAPGCSVSDWQCVRATSYLLAPSVAPNPLPNAQAASYIAQGFEIGVHVDSVPDCEDWTPSQLVSFYSSQTASFRSKYTSVPSQKTHRMHCIGWSDYDSQPQTELQNGIRLDTNYYYWPPDWINDIPGMFTGSGMPMRFTKKDGTMLDIYQATTQMTDESGQTYPLHIDTLLDNAIGAAGYYGYFTANMHNDVADSPEADAIISSAQSRGVPIISAGQLLTWLDGRNGSSFTSMSWNGSALTFGIGVGSGAAGLQAMLPANSISGALSTISLNGTNIAFTLKTIKGTSYAVFPASAGTYQATYSAGGGVSIASIALNPPTVVGGTPSTGSVTLNGPAPSGGVTITLSTSDATDTSLGSTSVTVPQGATSASFAVNTNVVTTSTNVTISATYSGNTVSADLTVTPAPTLASITLSPSSLTGGTSSTGTVLLTQPAPGGGVTVNLGSDNPLAIIPATVTVGAGSTSATFTIGTNAVGVLTQVTITATYGSSMSTLLTVNPPVPSSLAANPASIVGGGTSTGTVTLNGPAPAMGEIVTLSSSNPTVATVPASVTVVAGSTTATFPITTLIVTSSTSVTITASYGTSSTSVSLTVNPVTTLSGISVNPTSVIGSNSSTATVSLTQPAPSAGITVTLSSSNSSVAVVPATVNVAAGSTTGTFTVTTNPVSTPTAVSITATYGASGAATLTVNPPTPSSVVLNPTSVIGGNNSTGTVTLNGPAPTGGASVLLSSSNTSAATVPVSVTVAAGSSSASFVVSTPLVSVSTPVTISATYGGGSASTVLTVSPPPAVSTLTLSPTSLVGGNSSTGTVTLTQAAPTGGVIVSLASANSTVAAVPTSVTVAAGTTGATFTITTTPLALQTAVVITASAGGANKTATLTVNPPALSSITRSPATVTGGSNSTGTVTLSGRAPTGGIMVTLASANPAVASVPASVTVAAGSTSATFTIATTPVGVSTAVVITASLGSVNRTATLTVNPPAPSSVSLSPGTVVGGATSTGTVTLNGLAPASGIVVSLTSSNTTAATVPGSVTVPAGATTAQFTIATSFLTVSTTSTISASVGTATRTARLTVNATALTALTLSPSTVKGGSTSTGTVTLNAPAPPAGITVTLSSGNGYATVPASVTIPSGAATASFTINTPVVTTTRTPRISAVYNAVTRSASLTVTP